MSGMLFDVSPEDVPDRKKAKKPKNRLEEGPSSEIPAFSVPRQSARSAPPSGAVVNGVPCIYEPCRGRLHDLTHEKASAWRIECWECGTGQWIEPAPDMLEMPTEATPEEAPQAEIKESAGDFVFDDGWAAGKTVAEVYAECGLETVKMLGSDKRHTAWATPVEKWLAENGRAV